VLVAAGSVEGASLGDLAQAQEGRSRHETSTARLPGGDFDPNSNRDNSNVKPLIVGAGGDFQSGRRLGVERIRL